MKGIEFYEKRGWVTITELTGAARCLRRFFYKTGCGLVGRELKIAQDLGTAIHSGLAVGIERGLEAALQEFDKSWTPEHEEMGDDKRNRRNASSILQNFIASHTGPLAPYEIIKPPQTFPTSEKHSDWEIPFAIDIGLPVPLIGRMDGLARMRATGDLWVVEYKTTSMWWNFFDAFQLNPQTVGYTLAARTVLKEEVRGCIVEGILVSKTKNETQFQPIWVQDHHVAIFINWARFWYGMIAHCEETGEFPQNLSGCNQISGFGTPGYPCEYLPLCGVQEDWTVQKDLFRVDRHIPFVQLTREGQEVASGR